MRNLRRGGLCGKPNITFLREIFFSLWQQEMYTETLSTQVPSGPKSTHPLLRVPRTVLKVACEAQRELGGRGHLPRCRPSSLGRSQLDAQAQCQATADSVAFGQLSILAWALPVGLMRVFVGVRPQTTPLTRGFHACRLCFGEGECRAQESFRETSS